MHKIILISGKQGSGKTTLATAIKEKKSGLGFVFVGTEKFADTLYELHNYLLNRMESLTNTPRAKKDGHLLQILGTEWGRKTFGDNVWVDILKRKVTALGSGGSKRLTIIDDCRFENEFDAFPEALRIRLECSEEIRKQRAESWRDASSHPSEIGLDEYSAQGKFDLVFDTGKDSVDHCATLIMAQLQKDSWLEKRI